MTHTAPQHLRELLAVAREFGLLTLKVDGIEATFDPRPGAAPVGSKVDDTQLMPQLTPDVAAELRRKSPDGLLAHERDDMYASSGG